MEFRTITRAAEAVAHYFDDNKDGVLTLLGVRRRVWINRKVDWLGLNLGENADEKKLINILEGEFTEEDVGAGEDIKQGKYILGYELTFTAPKSVSIMALVGNDFRLFEAHNNAIDSVLDEMAKLMALLVKPPVDHSIQRKFSIIGAVINHDTSPELDPDLHTHIVIPNIGILDNEPIFLSTERLDFIDDVRPLLPVLSEMYLTVLKNSVELMGYRTKDINEELGPMK
ncbi:relaxase domain-containing protein [Serratia ureilytica]|uniref:MobF family relaxase n=1 Tax=Serratia ureilytica TaxID=300181 RepID=UPI001AA10AD7|nr:MobF family relaxase [Serratia ureilytica]MBO1811603.1 relaxase domain-containing protein [Serratia ureilytica]